MKNVYEFVAVMFRHFHDQSNCRQTPSLLTMPTKTLNTVKKLEA
jgi:hypothetical protein